MENRLQSIGSKLRAWQERSSPVIFKEEKSHEINIQDDIKFLIKLATNEKLRIE